MVIEDETAELVNEGFNLSILRCGKFDIIEEYKVNWGSQSEQFSTGQEQNQYIR